MVWFRSLWRPRDNHHLDSAPVLGVLAFEVSSLMSKVIHLWQSLSDKQIFRLRQDINNSLGISKLVSDETDTVAALICAEIMDNMGHIARAVARLVGRNCNDNALKNFQHLFNDLIDTGIDPYGWTFSSNKMEKKTKKMQRFISLNANLYQEIEILTDLEQSLKRMKTSDDAEGVVNLVDFEKKVDWKKQDLKRIKDISLWNKTYDYTLLLLARSLFTIFARIKHVFAIDQTLQPGGIPASGVLNNSTAYNNQRNPSLSVLMQSSDHRSPNDFSRFSSGPLMKSSTSTRPGPMSGTANTSNFYSGPLQSSTSKSGLGSSNFYSGPLQSSTSKSGFGSGTNNSAVNFFSGPLGKQKTKSRPLSGTSKAIQRLWQRNDNPSVVQQGKNLHTKRNGLVAGGSVPPLKSVSISSLLNSNSNDVHSGVLGRNNTDEHADSDIRFAKLSIFSPKRRLLNAPTDTLGGAALALHYANVIIVIEKLVASPHLIGHDARDDLYNMLPTSVRASLRERLKPYAKSLSSSLYDTALAREWSDAMAGILEWLAPLAHNMIRWQSERSFEQQNFVSKTNVLLVQTLYFANQEKTEAIITELLVGLNYIWRCGRELNAKALLECPSSKIFDEYLDLEG